MRSAVIPSQASLRDASSPEGGSFIRADRKMPKSSPFGGAGCDHREQTERVQPAESLQKPFPQRRAFAESGAAPAVSLHDPSRENAFGAARRPRQTRNIK